MHAQLVEDDAGEDDRRARGGVEEDLVPHDRRLLAHEEDGLDRAVAADREAGDDLVVLAGEGADRDEREVHLALLEHRGAPGRHAFTTSIRREPSSPTVSGQVLRYGDRLRRGA